MLLADDRLQRIQTLLDEGQTYRQIGKAEGVSGQRIAQLIAEHGLNPAVGLSRRKPPTEPTPWTSRLIPAAAMVKQTLEAHGFEVTEAHELSPDLRRRVLVLDTGERILIRESSNPRATQEKATSRYYSFRGTSDAVTKVHWVLLVCHGHTPALLPAVTVNERRMWYVPAPPADTHHIATRKFWGDAKAAWTSKLAERETLRRGPS